METEKIKTIIDTHLEKSKPILKEQFGKFVETIRDGLANLIKDGVSSLTKSIEGATNDIVDSKIKKIKKEES